MKRIFSCVVAVLIVTPVMIETATARPSNCRIKADPRTTATICMEGDADDWQYAWERCIIDRHGNYVDLKGPKRKVGVLSRTSICTGEIIGRGIVRSK